MKTKLLLFIAAAGLIFSSCSMSKKINQNATVNLFTNPPFAPAFTGISIFEPATNKYWYNHLEDKYFVPASNTKIVSCYAAMKHLGDSLPGIRYRIINDSTVVIRPTGDPTFLHPDYAVHPVYNFLKKFRHIQIEEPTFNRFMGNGWAWGDYLQYYSAQRSAMPVYGNIITAKTAGNSVVVSPTWFQHQSEVDGSVSNGFSVFKPWDSNAFRFTPGTATSREIPFLPDNATLLALLKDTLKSDIRFIRDAGRTDGIIYSQPVDSFLKPMMYRSDNFYAEQVLLMISSKYFGVIDERRAIDTLLKSDFTFLPLTPRWADGSGLSRYNHFSPKDFIAILDYMQQEFGMYRIRKVFATGGHGTLSSYYKEDEGYLYAKTGTLNGVVSLSGFMYTKKNKFLLFSVLVNHHNTSSTDIRKGVEQFIQYVRNTY